MLTIYTKPPGWNLVHKHKTIKFDEVGERTATKYIQISWTDSKEWKNCIAANHSPYFLKLPRPNGTNQFDLPTRKFRFFHVNGKYPGSQSRVFTVPYHGATHGGDAIKNLCRPSVQSDLISTILVIRRKPNPTITLFYLIFIQNNLEVPFFICLLLGKLRIYRHVKSSGLIL